jgi:hypothetical protein
MLLRRCVQYVALFLTTLFVSEQIPLINTIDPGSSEASQLLSTLSEFANGAKENIVEIITRPSEFFHGNENDQDSIVHEPPIPPPASPPLEPPPVSLSRIATAPGTYACGRSHVAFFEGRWVEGYHRAGPGVDPGI